MLKVISYVIDVYQDKYPCEKNFFKYLLYLSFFPAIVQGPISRYNEFLPQIEREKNFNLDQFIDSILLILLGLVKKMVIADRAAIFANNCFHSYDFLHGFTLYFGALCYTIQLYADFSGCVDICRGTSMILGIDLPENFRAPYFSCSVKEFWGRWHISFSSWLKDYVYIPLGGNRRGQLRKYINLLITFLISGIWHGAGVHYILWGLLHGMYQIAGELLEKPRRKLRQLLAIEETSLSCTIYRTVITFNLVTFAWIFFRAESLSIIITYLQNMFTQFSLWTIFTSAFYANGLTGFDIVLLLMHIVLLAFIERASLKGISVISEIRKLHFLLRWFVYVVIIMDLLLFGIYGAGYDASGFLYGGF